MSLHLVANIATFGEYGNPKALPNKNHVANGPRIAGWENIFVDLLNNRKETCYQLLKVITG